MAVALVLYAYEHGQPGDIFVQKAPAATIETLAAAMKKLFQADNPIQVIGPGMGRSSTKRFSRVRKCAAEDLGGYFRIPADNRDLNYAAYFTEGREQISVQQDYNSHNTRRLDVDERRIFS